MSQTRQPASYFINFDFEQRLPIFFVQSSFRNVARSFGRHIIPFLSQSDSINLSRLNVRQFDLNYF